MESYETIEIGKNKKGECNENSMSFQVLESMESCGSSSFLESHRACTIVFTEV